MIFVIALNNHVFYRSCAVYGIGDVRQNARMGVSVEVDTDGAFGSLFPEDELTYFECAAFLAVDSHVSVFGYVDYYDGVILDYGIGGGLDACRVCTGNVLGRCLGCLYSDPAAECEKCRGKQRDDGGQPESGVAAWLCFCHHDKSFFGD